MTAAPTPLSPPLQDLAIRLRQDAALLDASLDVGPSGVEAPRTGGAEDKATGAARALARELFPSTEEHRQGSYVQYGQLIARLRTAYMEQQELQRDREAHASLNPFRRVRLSGKRELFEKLLAEPPSIEVMKPSPMPVTIAPESELKPVFAHLRSGSPIDIEMRVFDRGAVYRDGRVDMCKQVVGPTYIEQLTQAVAESPNVQHFLLGNNVVGDTGATAIAEMVRARSATTVPLETLYLAGNEITATGAADLARSLESDTTVTSLWLKRNPLGPAGVEKLATMLRSNSTLEVLDLVNTSAGDEGVEALFDVLRENTVLRVLYLDANAITARGAHAIADYFRFLKAEGRVGLTGLFLGINRLGDDGATALADGIRNCQPLQQIDLGSNRIQSDGLRSILDAVSTIKSVQSLGLGLYKSTSDMGELPNYFDGEGVDMLTQYLRSHHNISLLDIKDTNLRPDGWPLLVDALETNPMIVNLAFTQFGLTLPREIHDRIAQVLRRNVQDRFGMPLEQFRRDELRYLKQPPHVRHIDSIYRNAM